MLAPATHRLVLQLMEQLQSPGEGVHEASQRLCRHLLEHYRMPDPCNDARSDGERLALAPWQERKAKEILAGCLLSRLYIADVAEQCGLSRSHFSRAFKQATGFAPRNGRCACASTAPASCWPAATRRFPRSGRNAASPISRTSAAASASSWAARRTAGGKPAGWAERGNWSHRPCRNGLRSRGYRPPHHGPERRCPEHALSPLLRQSLPLMTNPTLFSNGSARIRRTLRYDRPGAIPTV